MANSDLDEFLHPKCNLVHLDRYIDRKSILSAITAVLPQLHGTVLDIGCGRMPYSSLILSPATRVQQYIGMDLGIERYGSPDVVWDGLRMPFGDGSVDCAVATEVFEHTPEPELVIREACRVLKPGGLIFFTVPFVWPLHNAPHDFYRFTPYAMERYLARAGFREIDLRPHNGWDASLAQMLALWATRRPMSRAKRSVIARVAVVFVRMLLRFERQPVSFATAKMYCGMNGTAKRGGDRI